MPSSIFLSQSIRTFLPSVPSFSFMPCSFPFSISFLISSQVPFILLGYFLYRHISHLQARMKPWNDWRHNFCLISFLSRHETHGLIWIFLLISFRWMFPETGKLSMNSSNHFLAFMFRCFSCFLFILSILLPIFQLNC